MTGLQYEETLTNKRDLLKPRVQAASRNGAIFGFFAGLYYRDSVLRRWCCWCCVWAIDTGGGESVSRQSGSSALSCHGAPGPSPNDTLSSSSPTASTRAPTFPHFYIIHISFYLYEQVVYEHDNKQVGYWPEAHPGSENFNGPLPGPFYTASLGVLEPSEPPPARFRFPVSCVRRHVAPWWWCDSDDIGRSGDGDGDDDSGGGGDSDAKGRIYEAGRCENGVW